MSISVDLQRYKVDVKRTEEEHKAIRQEHLERIGQGKEVWNAWAAEVEKELEKLYSKTSITEQKIDIRNEYIIDFSYVLFDKKIFFQHLYFPIKVDLSFAVFEYDMIFDFVIFKADASFYRTNFKLDAIFENVHFDSTAFFQFATFDATTIIQCTTFSSLADFLGVIFKLDVYFNRVNFKSNVSFNNTSFIKRLELARSKFVSSTPIDISFNGANFEYVMVFDDNYFSPNVILPVDVRQTHFKNTPLMEGFPSDISVFKKKIEKSHTRKKLSEKEFKKYESQFRTLKRLAEANNNHQKSLEFYACELYCQRRATGGLKNIKNWAGFLYGLSSNYGLSLLRPFCFWLAIMFACIFGQAVVDKHNTFSWQSKIDCERVAFYAAPSLPPFVVNAHYQKEVRQRLYPTNNNNVEEKGKLPMPIRIIRGMQTFFTFIAIFLFGLALRNRFKIK